LASWQLQKAKTHFSEVIEDAHTKGPQIITRHGTERAVVMSIEEYRDLTVRKDRDSPNFIEFLLGGPKLAEGDNFFEIMDQIQKDRALDTGRDVEL
jgi:antitoxin Phd